MLRWFKALLLRVALQLLGMQHHSACPWVAGLDEGGGAPLLSSSFQALSVFSMV